MYSLLKSLFFLLSPEKAHYLAMDLLQTGLKIPGLASLIKSSYKPENQTPVEFCGITFPNSIGLAAGFDKDARWLHALQHLGFGHIEIGTLTPLAQDGNPQPRLFRLKKDESLINRMGFNNKGMDNAIERLKNRPKGLIVGGNIGKNKVTPNEEAISDYEICFSKIYSHVDYLVVNVSSPNTPGLRELQDADFLGRLFTKLHEIRNTKETVKPILLKIAPDITKAVGEEIAKMAVTFKVDGLIISNTTISRDGLKESKSSIESIGNGGLSGKAMHEKSTDVLKMMSALLPKDYPLIGVGGVYSKETAQNKLDAGARLAQLYTGFIYKGPGIVKQILD